jgi:ethanolamine utilization protein EutN
VQLATILGTTRATIKHRSLAGQRLLIVQLLLDNGGPDGPPMIALDVLGARRGDRVILTSDGEYAREITGSDATPARWSTAGIVD